jgi:hypothetical protein
MVVVMAGAVVTMGVIAFMCMISVRMVVMPMVVPMRIMAVLMGWMVAVFTVVVMVAIVCQEIGVNV